MASWQGLPICGLAEVHPDLHLTSVPTKVYMWSKLELPDIHDNSIPAMSDFLAQSEFCLR